jgi:uncharacterized protein with HEPN domain
MSERDLALYFVDILIAIDKINRYTKNLSTSNELLYNELVWDGVIRELQIIGDATNKLLKYKIIDEKNRRIVDFRNNIVHGYFGVDQDIVWDVVSTKIIEYKSELFEIINEKSIDLSESINAAKIENSFNQNVIVYLEELEKMF